MATVYMCTPWYVWGRLITEHIWTLKQLPSCNELLLEVSTITSPNTNPYNSSIKEFDLLYLWSLEADRADDWTNPQCIHGYLPKPNYTALFVQVLQRYGTWNFTTDSEKKNEFSNGSMQLTLSTQTSSVHKGLKQFILLGDYLSMHYV